MILYIEKKYLENPIIKNIINFYKDAKILEIDNYKNIFDKNLSGKTEKSLIIAGVNNAVLEAPNGYGFPGKGYFLKNSLNCIYDCKYCYLKGAFKNDTSVIFVNYDDMKKQILETLENANNNLGIGKNLEADIWFYSSDYSDNLAIDNLTNFTSVFIPFFEKLKGAKMEIRTKSVNIKNLLKLKPAKNTEIAFSLNPSEVIDSYELRTPKLDMRIKAINMLINNDWKVGIRFLPLLEVKNYKKIYKNFLKYILENIDFKKINSVFIGGLMFTHKDYSTILKKEPYLDLLYKLEKNDDGFYRENKEVRKWFYDTFQESIEDKESNICLDEY